MDNVIFHIDINHCYAQIEEMLYPELRKVPMAVGGHEETRHGIILTKNDMAKRYGIKTAESLRDAKKKCPNLLIIPPDYEKYIYYTTEVKKIYYEYSDCVESFGLDEAWIDFTHSQQLFGDPISVAKKIQRRVFDELGLTVSVGVSWNKTFAKFGSDLLKPYGFTVITKDNYKDIVWPRDVSELLYVGPATSAKLYQEHIFTIGDLANCPVEKLQKKLGVLGGTIWMFANGMDPSPVQEIGWEPVPKSIGNSITMVHDVDNLRDLKPVYFCLAESVASRLKEAGLHGNRVSVSIRNSDMENYSWQHKFDTKTNVSIEILHYAMTLMREYEFDVPLRAIGLSVGNLSPDENIEQMSLFDDPYAHEKEKKLDIVMDQIREKYGFYSVRRTCTLQDAPLTEFNVKKEHAGFHPVGYFRGRKMF